MGETLAQIDWTMTNVFRVAGIIFLTTWVLEAVMLLSHYRFRVVDRVDIFNPLFGTIIHLTFWLYLVLVIYALANAVSLGQRLISNDPPSLGAFTAAPVALAMTLITHMLTIAYSNLSKAREGEHLRQQAEDLSRPPQRRPKE